MTSPPRPPNRRYVGDITYLPLADGTNLYLATVIDCFSRRLAGWSIADHMRTELVEDALRAAAVTRGTLTGAIFHTDHGSVYTSKAFAKLCTGLGVTQSMGAVGTSADNALAEAFNATLKRETLASAAAWPDAPTCRRDGLPLGHPLQHPPTPLLLRQPQPQHLREPLHRYADARGITITPRVQNPGSRPGSGLPGSDQPLISSSCPGVSPSRHTVPGIAGALQRLLVVKNRHISGTKGAARRPAGEAIPVSRHVGQHKPPHPGGGAERTEARYAQRRVCLQACPVLPKPCRSFDAGRPRRWCSRRRRAQTRT